MPATPMIKFAVVASDGRFRELVCSLLSGAEFVERVLAFNDGIGAQHAIASGEVEAIFVEVSQSGGSANWTFIEDVRRSNPDIPFCLILDSSEMWVTDWIPERWRERINHYLKVFKNSPADAIAESIDAAARQMLDYWNVSEARRGIARVSVRLSPNADTADAPDVQEILGVMAAADTALSAKTVPAERSSVVPDLDLKSFQDLIMSTIGQTSKSLAGTKLVNTVVVYVGLAVVVISLLGSVIWHDWQPAVFGAIGMSGVIAAMVTSPLKTIGAESRRLIQIQTAYLGFLSQVRFLSIQGDGDLESMIERSKRLEQVMKSVQEDLNQNY